MRSFNTLHFKKISIENFFWIFGKFYLLVAFYYIMGEEAKYVYLLWEVSAEKFKDVGENKLPEQMGSVGLLVNYVEMQLWAWCRELSSRPFTGMWLILGVFLLSLTPCFEFLYSVLPWLSTEISCIYLLF